MPRNGGGHRPEQAAASNCINGPVKDLAVDSKPRELESAAETWRNEALRVIAVLGRTGTPFHVDDFLALVGYPPDPHQLGAAFAAAKQQHLIEVAGATIAKGRLVRVWRGVPA